ncbi:MAG: PilZ domain-containing protein [Desulfobacterales bacterium]|nr:PilZ domain-containing protein [Desulfobacterales bacterium]
MEERGKITGDKRSELFETLKEENTLLTLHIAGKNYERLTMVNEVRSTPEGDLFVIDPPRGFDIVVKNLDPWKLNFRFNGPDKLEYIFSTAGGEISGGDIIIPFPEVIERIQRRRHFRMETPMGCRFLFAHKGIQREISLTNISEGGCLGVLTRLKKEMGEKPLLKMGDSVHQVDLILPSGDEGVADRKIQVKKATVRRIEQEAEKGLHKFAFEFIDLPRKDKTSLTQFIYHLQRLFLRRR